MWKMSRCAKDKNFMLSSFINL